MHVCATAYDPWINSTKERLFAAVHGFHQTTWLLMLKYLYDSASGLGDVIAPTPENLAPDVKNRLLYEASYENDVRATYDLIFVGASPCALNEVGNAAIHVAAREGNLKIVKIFVEANRQCINLRGRGGNTALHYAASGEVHHGKAF